MRGELGRLEFLLDRLLQEDDGDDHQAALMPADGHGALLPVVDQPGSYARRVIALLDAEPARTFSVEEIVRALGAASSTSTRATLARLSRAGDVIRTDPGRFQSAAKLRAMDAKGGELDEDVRATALASLAGAVKAMKTRANGASPPAPGANDMAHLAQEANAEG